MQHLVVKRFPLNCLKFNGGCNLFAKFSTSSIMFQELEHLKVEQLKIVKPQPLEHLHKIEPLPVFMNLDKDTIDRFSVEFTEKYGVDFKKFLPDYVSAINECIKNGHGNDKFMNIDFTSEQLHINLEKGNFKFTSKCYSSSDFLEMGQHFLRQFPPDCQLTCELLWGSLSMLCREFFAPMEISIFTSYATKGLFKFAAVRHPDEDMRSDLHDTITAIFGDHQKYYNGSNFDHDELEIHCRRVEDVLKAFREIDVEKVKKDLAPFLAGEKTKGHRSLNGIKFVNVEKPKKPLPTQIIIDKNVEYKYEAK